MNTRSQARYIRMVAEKSPEAQRIRNIEDLITDQDLLLKLIDLFLPYHAKISEQLGTKHILSDLSTSTAEQIVEQIVERAVHED